MSLLNRPSVSGKADWATGRIIISSDPNERAIQSIEPIRSHAHFPVSGRVFFTLFVALPFASWSFSQVSASLDRSTAQAASASHATLISHVPSKAELARTLDDIPDFVRIPKSGI